MEATINIRVTKAEKTELARIAREAGMSLSAFLRSAAVVEARKVFAAHPPRIIDERKAD